LTGVRVSLDWFSMVLGRVAVLLMLVAVAAPGLSLVFHVAGLGEGIAGLGDRVVKYLFD